MSQPTRFRFIVDDDVEKDIEDVEDTDPDQAATLIVLIEEVKGDHALCSRLIDEGYVDEQIAKVAQFASMQRNRYNAYTVRCADVDDWRLITAVDHRKATIALLYIMKRSEDYDETVQQRVAAAYDKLGLEKLGRA
ncbi:hypothetical protein [Sphingobium sp. ZW T5_29]|uniref:hypothetical protein n=1 Tax=Sphingobium sp. ZW T5_29 TaxID=3378077 RepID=UPI0038536839